MRDRIRIINRTQGTLLGDRIELADSWWDRLRGYLGRSSPRQGEGLLLSPCKAVHTYGMGFKLDVIFLGALGDVLEVVSEMEPWKRSPRVPSARYVLEVPAGTVRATGTSVGDTCTWSPVRRLSMAGRESE